MPSPEFPQEVEVEVEIGVSDGDDSGDLPASSQGPAGERDGFRQTPKMQFRY